MNRPTCAPEWVGHNFVVTCKQCGKRGLKRGDGESIGIATRSLIYSLIYS